MSETRSQHPEPQPGALSVQKTARYYTLGEPTEEVETVWFALHGYGQLARYFARSFRPLASHERLFVLPEALSRFYLALGTPRIGATWMTREDREAEIADAVAYLDALHERILDDLPRTARVGVLGFSQGATMACRWVLRSAVLRADRLVLWAGGLPHDEDLAAQAARLAPLVPDFVAGTRDDYITEERLAKEIARLDDARIPHRLHRFDGDHRLDAEVLREVIGATRA